MPALVDRVDELQRRRRVLGVPLAVVYKFFDDQGGYLASVITYYAFVAIFPILLIASSVLGFVLQGHPTFKQDLLNSTLAQFPIVGDQLGRPEGIRGSTSAVVIGSVAALYGVIGLGQAAHNAVNVTWAIPRNSRLNPFVSRLRSLVWLVVAGLSLVLVTVVSSFGSHLDVVLGADLATEWRWTSIGLAVGFNTGVLTLMMRLSTPRRERVRDALPGALLIAVFWQLLQILGGVYVQHVIGKASQMNAVFAVVLGLMALIYIASVIAMIGLEVNVVLTKELYPRALLTPFTDNIRMTAADQQVYREYAQAQRHKGFERIEVSFDQDPGAT
jgi:membrane protein